MRYVIIAALAIAACDLAPQPDLSVQDTARTVAPDTAAPLRASLGTRFDPRTVEIGDTVAGLTVSARDLTVTPGSPTGVAGSITFKGEVELAGNYRAHGDDPALQEPCFWVDAPEAHKLPRVNGDARVIWFCFENDREEIVRLLGPVGKDRPATIIIDNYTLNLVESDAWDEARLVRVLK